jgi:hypothetical protein
MQAVRKSWKKPSSPLNPATGMYVGGERRRGGEGDRQREEKDKGRRVEHCRCMRGRRH